MKKLLLLPVIFLFIACNNAGDQQSTEKKNPAVDSLEMLIEDGHVAGMGKMGRLTLTQKEVRRQLDSLNKLPAKAQQAAGSYKKQFDDLLDYLNQADAGMNVWMENYFRKKDSVFSNAEEKIKYLVAENSKVEKMNEAIVGSLALADSVLKKNFYTNNGSTPNWRK